MDNPASELWKQAEEDGEHARSAFESEDYELSCYDAQQSARKALKSLYSRLNAVPWGNSLLTLFEGLPGSAWSAVAPELLDSARALDAKYVPRYPSGFSEDEMTDYFTRPVAEDCMAHAQSILAFCRSQIP